MGIANLLSESPAKASPAGYILDIIILVGLFLFVFGCAKRGFINVFFSFVSSVVALIAAISLAGVFASITGGLFGLEASLAESFTETFSKAEGFNITFQGKEELEFLLETDKIPAIIATLIAKKYVGAEIAPGTTLGMLAGGTVAELLCSLIAGIILFIIFKILILILRKFFTKLTEKIGLLDKINRLLGMVVGLIEGVFIISIIMSVLALIPSPAITAFFNNSLILKFLYNHNPIVTMLGWFL